MTRHLSVIIVDGTDFCGDGKHWKAMIRCENCGRPNDDGATFCTACNHFLAWAEPDSEPEPAQPPTPTHTATADTADTATGTHTATRTRAAPA